MRMIEIDYDAQPPVDSYGPGGFRIAGEWYAGSVLIMPEQIEGIETSLEELVAEERLAPGGRA